MAQVTFHIAHCTEKSEHCNQRCMLGMALALAERERERGGEREPQEVKMRLNPWMHEAEASASHWTIHPLV